MERKNVFNELAARQKAREEFEKSHRDHLNKLFSLKKEPQDSIQLVSLYITQNEAKKLDTLLSQFPGNFKKHGEQYFKEALAAKQWDCVSVIVDHGNKNGLTFPPKQLENDANWKEYSQSAASKRTLR
jgi:hypothetical protein